MATSSGDVCSEYSGSHGTLPQKTSSGATLKSSERRRVALAPLLLDI